MAACTLLALANGAGDVITAVVACNNLNINLSWGKGWYLI